LPTVVAAPPRVQLKMPEGASVGEVFRIARVVRHLSWSECAAAIGVSKKTYSRIEAGTREPRDDEITRFAELVDQDEGMFHNPEAAPHPVA
jgi:transcriptional regulator with XRE-family HTH domain